MTPHQNKTVRAKYFTETNRSGPGCNPRPALLALVAALLALFAAAALAQETGTEGAGGVELLRDFLAKTPAAQITLSRHVVDLKGDRTSAGLARLYLLRPDKFRLEHDGPEELLIVSDGETVWTYEADLSQAVRRAYSQTRQMGALAMLAGDAPESHFQLSAAPLPDANGARWISAQPRADADADAPATITIRAGFSSDGELTKIELRDALGGIVELSVLGISRQPPPDSLFEFVPPPGTDVVSDDG